MVGGIVSLLSNLIRRSVLSRSGVMLVVGLVLVSWSAASISSSEEANLEVSGAQKAINVACVGWQQGTVSTRQRLHFANASEPGTPSLAIKVVDKIRKVPGSSLRETDIKPPKYKFISAEGEGSDLIPTLLTVQRASSPKSGLAVDQCRTPETDWWFAGINTQAGYSANLFLVNPDSVDTIVNLTAFTSDGERTLTEYQRVIVRANNIKRVDLNRAIPGEASVTLRVQAPDGRVAAHIQTEVEQGIAPWGRAINSPVSGPATTAMIVGIGDKVREPELHLLSPTGDATVKVSLLTSDGEVPIGDNNLLNLSSSVVKRIALTDELQGKKAALLIESDKPVIASVSLATVLGNKTDYEILSAQPAVVRLASISAPSELTLSGIQGVALTDTEVTVTAVRDGQVAWTSTQTLPAGKLRAITLGGTVDSAMLITIKVSTETAYFTAWLEDKTSAGSFTGAHQLSDPESRTIGALKLRLTTS